MMEAHHYLSSMLLGDHKENHAQIFYKLELSYLLPQSNVRGYAPTQSPL